MKNKFGFIYNIIYIYIFFIYIFLFHREDQFNQALEKAAEIKNDEMTQSHNLIIIEQGEKKIEDLK